MKMMLVSGNLSDIFFGQNDKVTLRFNSIFQQLYGSTKNFMKASL